jgi:hypothetical protein
MRLAGAAGEQKGSNEGGKTARTVGHKGSGWDVQGMNLTDMNDRSQAAKRLCNAF